jgi:glucose/arabinose dehydrogenase
MVSNALKPAVVLLVLVAAVSRVLPAQSSGPTCASDNAGLTLLPGFCALVVADNLGRARHLTVASNGDVFVAVGRGRGGEGRSGVVVLRDTSGDGVADVQEHFASGTGDDVEVRGEYLYFSTNDAVMRYPWREGSMQPAGAPDTIVSDLPATRSHRTKTFAFGTDGSLYVNIGSPSNVCGASGAEASPDPCPEVASRAGIWRFDADRSGQTQTDGTRFAQGLRNTVALASRPQDGFLYGVVHGRDRLGGWPFFDDVDNAEKPAEEFVRIEEGDNVGWPYCYYDPEIERKVLAPEYGGDGSRQGRCADMKDPLIGFPAHWAPDGLLFYAGDQLPQRYRGGAFVVFHGSWNRAPEPQAGYKVVFAPFEGGNPTGEWEVFADGFAGDDPSPQSAAHRPVGIAEGPDGSLYVSDDRGGRIYRILFRGH